MKPCDSETLVGWGVREALPAHPRGDVRLSSEITSMLLSEPSWMWPHGCAHHAACAYFLFVFGRAPSWHPQADKVKQDQRSENNVIFYRRK